LKNVENKKSSVLEVLENVNNLPSIPVVLTEVNKLLNNDGTSATELGEVISKDQGLVTKILVVANSPLYGIPRRVSTIDFAIVILGFNHIKNIVISLSMMEAFKAIHGIKFNQRKFWQHSLLTALTSKKISDDLGYYFSGEAFTAGLLHDLGIPIIYKFFNKEYLEIIEKQKESGKSFLEIEEEVLGTTHCKIGEFLINKWNLPNALADVVANHHKPGTPSEFSEITSVVHLADYMLNLLQVGDFDWDKGLELDSSILSKLSLNSKEYLDGLIANYEPLIKEQINSTFF
jgi:putative nucleotidyltransferase with HDIG domain